MTGIGGLFRSTEEQVEPLPAKIIGNIPDWLNGSLLRVGPGKFDLSKDFVLNHWCDGYAVLYKFEIKNGKVTFIKKFLQSDAYKKATVVGRPVFTEFGTRSYPDPCKNVFSRMFSTLVPDLTDNDSLNLFTLEDTLFAATETNLIRKIDPKTLDTGDKVDLQKLVGVNLASSHTYQDDRGIAYTLGTSLMMGFKYHVVKIPSTKSKTADDALKKSSILATIPSRWKSCVSYYHSYGMADNWIVFVEQPFIMSGMKLISTQVKGKSMRDCLEWLPEESNIFYAINKTTGKILPIKYKSDAFFVFHHINTYEENGHLIVDLIGHDSPEIVDKMYLKKLRMSEFDLKHKSVGRRFVLPIIDNIKLLPDNENLVTLQNVSATAEKIDDYIKLKGEILTEPGYELPVVNKAYFGKKYRYFYASGLYDKSKYRSSIVKVDLETKEVRTWYESDDAFPGEVQFVPRPDSQFEDDGLILSAVTDLRADKPDYLLILDAVSLTEIAKAEISAHIPNVLHGIFLQD